MTWMWLSMVVVLLGAKLEAEVASVVRGDIKFSK